MTKEKTNHSNQQTQNTGESIQQATLKRLKSLSPFWLLPFIALVIGIILFIKIAEAKGETITIYFDNAAGITANKTAIRYQGLQIGTVRKINFSEDLNKIIVTANINNEARNVLRKNTKFWVVKPNASLAGISGLDALVSGNYITLSPGDGEPSKVFTASTEGPIAQLEAGDLMIQLVTDNLASINIGTPIFYRNMNVGIVADYHFNENIEKIEINAIIHKPYTHLVKNNSQFWRHTGLSIEASLSGFNFNMNNLSDLIIGGISFNSPPDSPQAAFSLSYNG